MDTITTDTINTKEETSIIKDYFDYSETMQLQIIAELLRNKAFAGEILTYMRPQYFTKDRMSDIIKVLKDYWSKYGNLPTNADIYLDHFSDLSLGDKSIKLDEQVKKTVKVLMGKNPDGSWEFEYDPKVVIRKTDWFIREAAVKDALWSSALVLGEKKTDKYERIVKIITKACDVDAVKSQVPLAQRLTEKMQRDMNRTSKFIGYDLDKFEELARHTDGIQPGFYIISADTNSGKTALLTNLALDIIQKNPQVSVIYFSCDDSDQTIMNRMLGILSELHLNELQKQLEPAKRERLAQAYATLTALAEAGRLNIYDIATVRSVAALESIMRRNYHENLVVFIDGMYNLEVNEKSRGMREDNVDRAIRVKALAETHRIPVICSGELRKRSKKEREDSAPSVDDLMESGKYAYNADVVLLLHPESMLSYSMQDSPIMIVEYVKNKLSHYRGTQRLVFHRAQSRMEEEENTPLAPFSLKKSA